jgi:hypothetical protein
MLSKGQKSNHSPKSAQLNRIPSRNKNHNKIVLPPAIERRRERWGADAEGCIFNKIGRGFFKAPSKE